MIPDLRQRVEERKIGKSPFVETDMNRSGSHPGHENRLIIISTVLIRRGGGGAYHFRGHGGLNPHQ